MFGSRDRLKARLPPRVPDGERVYAVGDIHGRADLLAQLQDQILADAAGRAPARQTVVYLGDYVDRGPQSPVVIDRLIDAPLAGFTSVHLLGNHEDIMLRFHDGDVSVAASWLQYGGRQTLASYGIECDRLPIKIDGCLIAVYLRVPELLVDILASEIQVVCFGIGGWHTG